MPQIVHNEKFLRQALVGAAWTLCLCLGAMCGNTLGQAPVRYTTRFETQNRVTYEPQVQLIEQTVTKSGWNPFRPKPTIERRVVPVVRWVPRAVEERMPITERQALRGFTPSFAQGFYTKREDERDIPNDNRSRSRELGALTKSTFARPPSQSDWRAKKGANHWQTAEQFGGVQRFDEDAPRVGMQLRSLR